jgi:DNA-binding NtrC family response regulator
MLSDVSMPRMNGPEAAVEVKQLRPSIRMVFMSGFADERALPQIESFPLIPMVHKPFHRDTLLDVIHDVLRREEAA